jgi:hypothetical protein
VAHLPSLLPNRVEADLVALPVEDDLSWDVPGSIRPGSPGWPRLAAIRLGVVAAGALVTIAWQQRQQTAMMRYQQCITAAQNLPGHPTGGPQTRNHP